MFALPTVHIGENFSTLYNNLTLKENLLQLLNTMLSKVVTLLAKCRRPARWRSSKPFELRIDLAEFKRLSGLSWVMNVLCSWRRQLTLTRVPHSPPWSINKWVPYHRFIKGKQTKSWGLALPSASQWASISSRGSSNASMLLKAKIRSGQPSAT